MLWNYEFDDWLDAGGKEEDVQAWDREPWRKIRFRGEEYVFSLRCVDIKIVLWDSQVEIL